MKELIFFLFFLYVSSEYTLLKKRFITKAKERSALCNDGSVPIFFANITDSRKKWLLYIQGGGGCYSKESCDYRYKNVRSIMTSIGHPEEISYGNVFDDSKEKNPGLYDTNKVFIHYCTSDWHSGNRTKGIEGYHFLGRNVIRAVVDDLLNYYGMDQAEQVVLSGSSAGGVGTWTNSDSIAAQIKEKVPNVDYKVITDVGYFLDGPSFQDWKCVDDGHCNYEYRMKHGQKMWGLTPHEDCASFFIGEEWKCLVGYYVQDFIKSKTMTMHYLTDNWQIEQDGIDVFPNKKISELKKDEKKWIYKRSKFTSEKSKQFSQSYWVMGCLFHGVLPFKTYNEFATNDGVTPAMAVYQFVVENKIVRHIDSCTDVLCNKKCSNN